MSLVSHDQLDHSTFHWRIDLKHRALRGTVDVVDSSPPAAMLRALSIEPWKGRNARLERL